LSLEYINKYYGVPAEIGRIVVVNGRPGIIAEAIGGYIGVLFDDEKPTSILPCHPTWEVEYLSMGKVRKMTRSQRRYHDYLKADSDMTFAEWLGIKKAAS